MLFISKSNKKKKIIVKVNIKIGAESCDRRAIADAAGRIRLMALKEYGAVGVLAGAMFFRMFGVFAALPIAAIFAASLAGGEAAWATGMAVGGYGITQAAMQIPAGMLADSLGRKPVLAGLLLVFAAGGFIAAAADSVWELAAGRLLQGAGAVAAVAAAWITDIAAPERRARAMLVYGAGIALAFIAALILAPPLAGALGLSGVFSLSGWLGVLSAAAVLVIPSPPPPPKGRPAAFVNRPVLLCGAAAFAAHYVLAGLFLRTPPMLQQHLPLAEHWKIYAPAFALALPLGLLLIFRESWRASPPLSVLLAAAGATAVFLGGNIWISGAGWTLFFSGFMFLEAHLPARASRAAPAHKRGAALGVVLSMEFLGVFCGAATSGALAGAGATGLFLMIALLAGAFAIMLRTDARPAGARFNQTI